MIDRLARDLANLVREFVHDTGMLGSIVAFMLVLGTVIAILVALVLVGVLVS